MDWQNYLIVGIVLLIGIFIGWLLFRSTTPQKFIGLSPLLEEISNHTSIFLNKKQNYEEGEDIEFRKNTKKVNNVAEINQKKLFFSKGEEECIRAANEIFGCEFKKIRPNWLVNPKTGRKMELDGYNQDLKIAIEYNGKQHYVFPNGFHKTIEEFEKQKERDLLKLDLCDKNGVYLITVPYTIELKFISKYIEYYHPKNRSQRLKNGQTGSNI